jgi:hypothetical protein
VATWLHAHPAGTLGARDRAAAYAAGGRHGAPEATQVADRLPLLKHVASARQEVLHGQHRERAPRNHVPHNEPRPQEDDAVPVPTDRPVAMTKAQQQIVHHRAKRVAA